MNRLTVLHKTDTYTLNPDTGANLLDIIRELDIEGFSAPCGGKGTCGKCRIICKEGSFGPLSDQEQRHLDPIDIAGGTRLACFCTIPAESRLTVWVPASEDSRIQAYSSLASQGSHPRFRRLELTLAEATFENHQGRLEQVVQALKNSGYPSIVPSFPMSSLAELERAAGESSSGEHTRLYALIDQNTICDIQAEDTLQCGCAVDIGTTTVVMHLISLLDSTVLGTWSEVNEQKRFGADVISRIQYAREQPEHAVRMQRTISRQLNAGLRSLMHSAGVQERSLRTMTIAGNTTMLHLLTGCTGSSIAEAPFTPVFTEHLVFSGAELGLTEAPHVKVELLPSISAYVGADITAGISVTGLPGRTEPALLIDIGTNGEMAVGDHQQVVCCSTAAGPAFEGANIRYGTGGVSGAIDTVTLEEGRIVCTTIADKPAVGICGSGIIDAAALLISSGAADYTGRMVHPGNPDFPWIVDFQGSPALLLCEGEQTRSGSPIYFTQKDLREVQLAKAAIAGGIRTLLHERKLDTERISEVYLAGGFGSYINPASAGIIGLLPFGLAKKTTAVGNTAGEGAVRALLDLEELSNLRQIQRESHYIELSSHPEFQDFYIDEMYFGSE
jgi:uncharacterized 2Fe-2S/4Fe-4S cluster protein (DUF4445 family)